MSIDPLLVRARRLWEDLASVPVSFTPDGGVRVVVSPESGMCPAGWVGVVTLGGSAIVTAPSEDAAAIVRDALAGLPVEAVADADAVREVLSVARVLGPAALAYVSADAFRRVEPGALTVEQLPGEHPVGLKYRIRLLICEFVAVSTGDLILVDEPAEDRSAVDAVLGDVDGAWWSGFAL